MEYLRLFQEHSGYTEYKNSEGFLKPNVSHCVQENEVHYSKILPYITVNINVEETDYFMIGMDCMFHYSDITLDGVSIIGSMEYDIGYEISNGEHTLKYYFNDINSLPPFSSVWYNWNKISFAPLNGTMIIPNGVKRIDNLINTYCEIIVPDSLGYIGLDTICHATLSEDTENKLDSCCELPRGYLASCDK